MNNEQLKLWQAFLWTHRGSLSYIALYNESHILSEISFFLVRMVHLFISVYQNEVPNSIQIHIPRLIYKNSNCFWLIYCFKAQTKLRKVSSTVPACSRVESNYRQSLDGSVQPQQNNRKQYESCVNRENTSFNIHTSRKTWRIFQGWLFNYCIIFNSKTLCRIIWPSINITIQCGIQYNKNSLLTNIHITEIYL